MTTTRGDQGHHVGGQSIFAARTMEHSPAAGGPGLLFLRLELAPWRCARRVRGRRQGFVTLRGDGRVRCVRVCVRVCICVCRVCVGMAPCEESLRVLGQGHWRTCVRECVWCVRVSTKARGQCVRAACGLRACWAASVGRAVLGGPPSHRRSTTRCWRCQPASSSSNRWASGMWSNLGKETRSKR